MSKASSDIQDSREKTACFEITSAVKEYQECRFSDYKDIHSRNHFSISVFNCRFILLYICFLFVFFFNNNLMIIYIALFRYSFIALYNDYVNVEPKD